MKTILLPLVPVLVLSSCARFNSSPAPAAPAASNTYGVPGANVPAPAVPEAGSYQPIAPAVPPAPSAPAAPSLPATLSSGISPGSSYTVQSGDSLWRISKKSGISIEAIQTANSLTDTDIRTGQTLQIPAR